MSDSNDKSGSPLRPSTQPSKEFATVLKQHLTQLHNELHRLVACYHFYHDVMQAVLAREEPVPDPDALWHYGLLVMNDWMTDAGDQLVSQLEEISQWAEQQKPLA